MRGERPPPHMVVAALTERVHARVKPAQVLRVGAYHRTMADSDTLDVLVIGGGFSGLSAARELAQLGVKVQLVDAFDNHLGGRAYGYEAKALARPARFDHGAQYVGDLQDELMAFIRAEMPDALVNGAAKRKPYPWEVMLLGGKRFVFRSDESAFGIPGCPPGMSALDMLGMVILIGEIEVIERSIDVLEPWNSPGWLTDLDRVSIAEWIDRPYVTPVVRDLMRISVEAILSVEPEEISPFYFLWYCACNDGFLNEINDSEGGPQQYWLSCSMSDVAERYAAPVRGIVTQGTRAKRIALADGDEVEVELEDASGARTVRARRVIVATSPATAGRIAYAPELPDARRRLLDMPMGRTIKCQVYYKTPWWRDSKGKQYDGYVGGANYPVLWVMDNSPENGDYVLMTFTVGAQADKLGPDPSHAVVEKTVTEALAYLFDDDRALATSDEFLELVCFRWLPSERNVGGGPNTVVPIGAMTGPDAPVRAMNEPWEGRVFFASAENAIKVNPESTQRDYDWFGEEHLPEYDDAGNLKNEGPFRTRYSDMREDLGYMNGAIVSGRYAAHQVAISLGKLATKGPASQRTSSGGARRIRPATPMSDDEVAALLQGLEREVLGSPTAESPIGRVSWFESRARHVLRDMGKVQDPEEREEAIDHLRNAVLSTSAHVASAVRSSVVEALERLDLAIDSVRSKG